MQHKTLIHIYMHIENIHVHVHVCTENTHTFLYFVYQSVMETKLFNTRTVFN